jgi:lysophospholipase L1-like esterase
MHIVLLGDSIFDNAAYTGRQPDVVTHLRAVLGDHHAATLCAIDGATIAGLAAQLRAVPRDATHIVVSIGGNDVLRQIDLLDLRVSSSRDALDAFGTRLDAFERAYRDALQLVIAAGRRVVLCTIYNGRLERDIARAAAIGLALFNDVILRIAFEHGLDVIELRLVCNAPDDYANPIEPSGPGGLKIAQAIARATGAEPGIERVSRVWV